VSEATETLEREIATMEKPSEAIRNAAFVLEAARLLMYVPRWVIFSAMCCRFN
jgi:hypothetical protein